MAVDVMQKKEIHLDHSGIHLMWSLLDLNSMDPCIMMCITMICPPSGMRSILQTNGLVCIACYQMRIHCIMYWNIIWLCVRLPVFQNSWASLHLLFWISNSELQTIFRLIYIYTHKYIIYSPTGRRNHGRPLKRLLDTWDQNGSTSGPTPWKIYDDAEYFIPHFLIRILVVQLI